MSIFNVIGLVVCLFGIIVHVIMKATAAREYRLCCYYDTSVFT